MTDFRIIQLPWPISVIDVSITTWLNPAKHKTDFTPPAI